MKLAVLFFFTSLAQAQTCGSFRSEAGMIFLADQPREVSAIYRQPQNEQLRATFVRETAATRARLGPVDPAILRTILDTRAENGEKKIAKSSANLQQTYEVNGLVYRLSSLGAQVPDIRIETPQGAWVADFGIQSFLVPIRTGEQFVPLHLSPDRRTLAFAIDAELHDRARLYFFSKGIDGRLRKTEVPLHASYLMFSWFGSDAGYWSHDSASFYFATQGDGRTSSALLRFRFRDAVYAGVEAAYSSQGLPLYDLIMRSEDGRYLSFSIYHGGRSYRSRLIDLSLDRVVYDTTRFPPDRLQVSYILPTASGNHLIESDNYRQFRLSRLECDGASCRKKTLPLSMEAQSVLSTTHFLDLNLKIAGDRLIALGYSSLRAQALVSDLKTGQSRVVPLPEGSDASFAGESGSGAQLQLKLAFKNPLQQSIQASLRISDGSLQVTPPPKDYDAAIQKTVLTATSADGYRFPVTVFYPAGQKPTPQTPLLVYYYGEDGTPSFANWYGIDAVVPFVKRGWAVAFPHVRGSLDLGFGHYFGGIRQNKWNGYQDALAALQTLHREGISSPDRTALRGMSAGGVLLGMMLAYAPERFKLAFFEWPLTDTLNGNAIPRAPIHSLNRFAMGDPGRPQEFRSLCPTSPLHQVRKLPARNRVWVSTSYGDINAVPTTVYAFYRWLSRLAPGQAYFYASTRGEHLAHSSPEEMADFVALEMGWAEKELSR